MAYIGMAYIGMTCIVMAYIGMAYIVMAYLVMAYIGIAYLGMAYLGMAYLGMPYIVMAYVVMMNSSKDRESIPHWCWVRVQLQSPATAPSSSVLALVRLVSALPPWRLCCRRPSRSCCWLAGQDDGAWLYTRDEA